MKKKWLFVTAVVCTALLAVGCGQKKAEVKTDYVDDLSKYITLGEYKGLEYVEEPVEVTEEEIQSELEYLAESYATQEQIKEGTAKDGDTVNIYFIGYRDGVAFEGGEGTTDLLLGSGQFIDGFEAGVEGMSVGETKSLNLTFPDPYDPNPDLSGAPVVFDVTLNHIVGERIVPEVTDAFIEENTDYATVDEYREYLKTAIEEYKTSMADSSKEEELWQQVMDNSEVIELPQDKLTETADDMYVSYEEYASYYGMDMPAFLEQMGMTEEEFRAEMLVYAEDMVKRALIFHAIIEAEGITIGDEEYTEKGEEMAARYGYTSLAEMEESIDRETIEEDMLWTKVYAVITENAKAVPPETEAE